LRADVLESVLLQQARGTVDAEWRTWDYERWNERLVAYCFRSDGSSLGKPVERIPATPEELLGVVGDRSAAPEDVAGTFVDSVLSQIPPGISFEGFCGDYRGWTPFHDWPPRFFAALWFTCLVAYGFPPGDDDGFHVRMERLFGRYQHLRYLPMFWEDLASWTARKASSSDGDGYRELVLPPYDNYRKIIGPSWFLAFPHRRDRHTLRQLLVQRDLVGEEPPIAPVVAALEENERSFGESFRRDLEEFVDNFVEVGADVRESAFWRAIRQEALPPREESSDTPEEAMDVGLMAFTNDGELFPYVACSDRVRPPEGFSARDLKDEIGGFSHFLVADEPGEAEESGMDSAAIAAFEGRLPVPKASLHAGRGVLVFQEVMINEYRLVGGSEANEADVALVREDRVHAFGRAYGGTAGPSRIPGWQQVVGCRVVVRAEAPAGLEGVRHLQETMIPPSVRLAGGVRTGAGFYAFPGFLPIVRFDGAERVEVLDGEGVAVGQASRSLSENDEWHLPGWLARWAPSRWTVRVSWHDAEGRARHSEVILVLVGRQIPHGYKRLGAGRYFVESCAPGAGESEGGRDIPIGITSGAVVDGNAGGIPDLVEFEPDLRYLGPGVGEFSPTPGPGFDWLVVGPRNRPDLLLFVGDTNAPTRRADRRCADAGARRHWQGAIHDSRRKAVRLPDGRVVPIAEVSRVERALREYRDRGREHAPGAQVVPCSTDGTESRPRWHGVEPDGRVGQLADALAALSVRRSGVRYGEMLDLFAAMVGTPFHDDPGLYYDLIRGWVEAGTMDVARAQGRRATYVVARRPGFVAFGVGGRIRAALLGLVPSVLEGQVRRSVGGRDCPGGDELLPPCRWLPRVVRIECDSPSALSEISAELGLVSPRWLRWPVTEPAEGALDVSPGYQQEELREGAAPEGFAVEGRWDWYLGRFVAVSPGEERSRGRGVRVEKRTHRERAAIYVVVVDGEEWAWTYARNWALLLAYSLDEESPPFSFGGPRSPIIRPEREGVYLPLPIGRLCAVLGDGLAGPVLGSGGTTVEEYRYPIGFGYRRSLAKWISGVGCVDFGDGEEG
jgi:hypothetical protein